MIIVHHLNNSRSQRVLWLLEELEAPYSIIRYERDSKTMLAPPELKAVHPLGKSPVITDGSRVVAETGAIIEYLLQTHDEGRLLPPAGSEERLKYTYWLHYAEGSAMTPLLMKLVFQTMPRRAPFLLQGIVGSVCRTAERRMSDPQITTHAEYWESELSKHGWFAGEQFTAADIMMSFPLEAAVARAEVGNRQIIKDFLNRIHSRPAYQRALEKGGDYAYAKKA